MIGNLMYKTLCFQILCYLVKIENVDCYQYISEMLQGNNTILFQYTVVQTQPQGPDTGKEKQKERVYIYNVYWLKQTMKTK